MTIPTPSAEPEDDVIEAMAKAIHESLRDKYMTHAIPWESMSEVYRAERVEAARAALSASGLLGERLLRERLARLIELDDEAKAAAGKTGATLNGYGLTDMFDNVGHPFGAGRHKQMSYRSVSLEVALIDARTALSNPLKAD